MNTSDISTTIINHRLTLLSELYLACQLLDKIVQDLIQSYHTTAEVNFMLIEQEIRAEGGKIDDDGRVL